MYDDVHSELKNIPWETQGYKSMETRKGGTYKEPKNLKGVCVGVCVRVTLSVFDKFSKRRER